MFVLTKIRNSYKYVRVSSAELKEEGVFLTKGKFCRENRVFKMLMFVNISSA